MQNLDIQKKLIEFGILDPPADGLWGAQSKRALAYFQKLKGLDDRGAIDDLTLQALENTTQLIPLMLGNDFASNIIRYMIGLGYFVSRGQGLYNIVYIEGANKDGTPNRDLPDEWNDRRTVIEIGDDGVPRLLGNWLATTEPGKYWTEGRSHHPQGAARIEFGQYRSWRHGYHKGKYRALVQVADVTVCRDLNMDYRRTGDRRYTGIFGINQHHGGDAERVGVWSAGCTVGQSKESHFDFMDIIERDARYLVDRSYIFWTSILPGDKLWTTTHQRSLVAA